MQYLVKVKPGSSQNKVEVCGKEITVWTHARAHDGEANKAIVELLAKHFRVAKGRVKIVKGVNSRTKAVEVDL